MFQLERNGFSVPGDVSLIGYDDSFYTGDIGLTTIRQIRWKWPAWQPA